MHRICAVFLGLGFLGNAAFMLGSPLSFYASVPGVAETGPPNVHFIRDIGCAYLVVALSLLWLAWSRLRAWPAALASGIFLSLHALVHVFDAIAAGGQMHHLASDALGVFVPAALVVWLALSSSRAAEGGATSPREVRQRRGLVGRLVEGSLASFEREFDYDLTYARDIVDTSAAAFVRFSLFSAFASQREGVPKDALFAAKVSATRREDCGPCTQLVVTMAEREGVAPRSLTAILAREPGGMSSDASLGFRFAEAVLTRDIPLSDALRAEVRERWGSRAVVSLAFAIASSRVYPAIKYALGHGRTCSRIVVAGKDAALAARPGATVS